VTEFSPESHGRMRVALRIPTAKKAPTPHVLAGLFRALTETNAIFARHGNPAHVD